MREMQKEKLKGHLAIAAAYTIFGLNVVFNKDIANAAVISPMVLFTLRAIGASAIFWLVSFFLPEEKVPKEDLPRIALASMVGLFIPQLTFLYAITMSTAIDTTIMGTLGPIFTMIFAFFFLKEPITLKKAGGVALSFAGVLFLIFNSVYSGGASSSSVTGIALLLINSISFSMYLGVFRPLISRYSVVTFMKWTFLFALLASLPFSLGGLLKTDFSIISQRVWMEIGFLIIFATFVAYFLIPLGQKRIRPTLVSLYAYIQPVIAAGISIMTGIDTLNWQKIAAIVLIAGGVVTVSFSRAAPEE